MLTTAEITAWLGQLLWPLFRCATALWYMPIFGDSSTPRYIRLALAASLAALVSTNLPEITPVDPFSATGLLYTIEQIIFGLAFALIIRLLFTIFTMAGQMSSMQMGLSMAVMNDPANGGSVPILGRWLQTIAFILFLAMDGHLVVIRVLADSFISFPIGSGLNPIDFYDLAHLGAWLFTGGFLITMPAIFSMLLVNLCFGVMSRSAPQLNIFALGFPMTMLFGMFTLYLLLISFPAVFTDMTESALWLLRNFAGV